MQRSRPMVSFVVLAYSISWTVFILLALNHHQLIFFFSDDARHARLQDLVHAFGGLGPLLAALITINLFYGKKSLQGFGAGYSLRKLTARGWALSVSPFLIFGISLVAGRIIDGHGFDIAGFFRNTLLSPFDLFAWLLPCIFYGFGEEGGWRGFALPLLQKRFTALTATLILCLIWAVWHIPSFFYRYHLHGAGYAGFLAGLFSGAFWLTFLFNYTRGSILAVSIWHLSFNIVSMVAREDEIISAAMSMIILLSALFVLIRFKFSDLAPFKKISWQLMKKMPRNQGVA